MALIWKIAEPDAKPTKTGWVMIISENDGHSTEAILKKAPTYKLEDINEITIRSFYVDEAKTCNLMSTKTFRTSEDYDNLKNKNIDLKLYGIDLCQKIHELELKVKMYEEQNELFS